MKYKRLDLNGPKMKTLGQSIYLILLISFMITFKGFSQNIDSEDKHDLKLMSVAREIMTTAKTCALITLDEESRARVRVMDPFIPEDDFTVWFGTNPKSRKVAQIKKNPRVTLYYLENDDSGYVMVYGTAQLVDSNIEKEKRWKDSWEEFYPNKPEDYLLIKVTPEWMEVVSYTHGIFGDPATWQPPKILFDKKN